MAGGPVCDERPNLVGQLAGRERLLGQGKHDLTDGPAMQPDEQSRRPAPAIGVQVRQGHVQIEVADEDRWDEPAHNKAMRPSRYLKVVKLLPAVITAPAHVKLVKLTPGPPNGTSFTP